MHHGGNGRRGWIHGIESRNISYLSPRSGRLSVASSQLYHHRGMDNVIASADFDAKSLIPNSFIFIIFYAISSQELCRIKFSPATLSSLQQSLSLRIPSNA